MHDNETGMQGGRVRGSEHTSDEKELVTANVGGRQLLRLSSLKPPLKKVLFLFCTNPQ